MKMAIIIPGFVPVPDVMGGAIERLITYLLDGNEIKKEFEIDLYTIDNPLLDKFKYNSTNLIKIKLNRFELFCDKVINHIYFKTNIEKSINAYERKLFSTLKQKKYNYILIENNMFIYHNIYKKYSKKYPNTKFLFHLHNDIGKLDKPYSLCNYISKTASRVLTCSNYLTNRFNNSTNTNIAVTLYNVIDLKNLNYSVEDRKKLRNKFGLNDTFLFGYIGRISKEKGTLELIKAYRKFKEMYSCDVKLVIIGDTLFGNTKNKYFQEFIKETENMKNDIIYTGAVNNKEISKYMSMLDCIIIPTICEEAFGIVAAEALACKCPIIMTNSGGMIEVVDNNFAIIVNKNNIVDELKNAMNTMYNDEKTRKSFGENGRKRIELSKDFHLENYYNNFINNIRG